MKIGTVNTAAAAASGLNAADRQRLLPLMVGHFLNDTCSSFLPAFLPLLITKFSLSLGLAGLLASVYSASSSFAQLLFGYAGDRWQRLNFVVLGPVLTGLFMTAVGVMPSYLFVALALFIAAMGTAMFHPQATMMAGAGTTGHRGFALSVFISAGTLGFALGPPAMAMYIEQVGFERTYWLALPVLLIAFYVWVRTSDSAKPVRSQIPLQGNVTAKTMASLALLWAIVVLRHMVFLAFMTFLVVLFQKRGLSYLAGNFSLFAFLAAVAIGNLLGGSLADRYGPRRVTVLSLVLAFPALLGFLQVSGPLSMMLLIVGGLCVNASNPVLVAYAQELAPARVGTASAVTMGLGWGVAGLLMGPFGALADRIGTDAAFTLVLITLPVAAVMALWIRERH